MENIKSPLNYTGNKFRILEQIKKHFPKKVSCMIDLFCGGATVGINVECDKVIFVDNNERVLNLLYFLSKQNFDTFIVECETIISKYIVSELSNKMIIENMHKLQSQEEYTKKYEELLKRYEKANVEYGRIQDEKLHKIGLSQKLESFIKDLENRPASIDYFDETTFRFMVESVKVSRDKKLTFKFRNGKEIEV